MGDLNWVQHWVSWIGLFSHTITRHLISEVSLYFFQKWVFIGRLDTLLENIVALYSYSLVSQIWQIYTPEVKMKKIYMGGGTWVDVCRVQPLASQSPYPIIVHFLANYRPHLSHFLENVIFAIPTYLSIYTSTLSMWFQAAACNAVNSSLLLKF